MLMQHTLVPCTGQVAVTVAALQRDSPKPVFERCEISPFRHRSFAATVLSVSHADVAAVRCSVALKRIC
jgi:hypothetical protein